MRRKHTVMIKVFEGGDGGTRGGIVDRSMDILGECLNPADSFFGPGWGEMGGEAGGTVMVWVAV